MKFDAVFLYCLATFNLSGICCLLTSLFKLHPIDDAINYLSVYKNLTSVSTVSRCATLCLVDSERCHGINLVGLARKEKVSKIEQCHLLNGSSLGKDLMTVSGGRFYQLKKTCADYVDPCGENHTCVDEENVDGYPSCEFKPKGCAHELHCGPDCTKRMYIVRKNKGIAFHDWKTVKAIPDMDACIVECRKYAECKAVDYYSGSCLLQDVDQHTGSLVFGNDAWDYGEYTGVCQ
ncbi:Uncharacterised protein g5757 [Pycnogonum litorale]